MYGQRNEEPNSLYICGTISGYESLEFTVQCMDGHTHTHLPVTLTGECTAWHLFLVVVMVVAAMEVITNFEFTNKL